MVRYFLHMCLPLIQFSASRIHCTCPYNVSVCSTLTWNCHLCRGLSVSLSFRSEFCMRLSYMHVACYAFLVLFIVLLNLTALWVILVCNQRGIFIISYQFERSHVGHGFASSMPSGVAKCSGSRSEKSQWPPLNRNYCFAKSQSFVEFSFVFLCYLKYSFCHLLDSAAWAAPGHTCSWLDCSVT